MSDADVKKNFALSADFNDYVFRNPRVLRNVPKKACIVFTVKSDPALSKKNLELARSTMRTRRSACYKAEKSAGKWRVLKLNPGIRG